MNTVIDARITVNIQIHIHNMRLNNAILIFSIGQNNRESRDQTPKRVMYK